MSVVMSKAIDVVAGIIFNESGTQILLSLRKPEQHQGNCWEFPGGKMEPSESQQQALVRELNEELGINVLQCAPFTEIEHDYKDKKVRLFFWQVSQFSGNPVGREAQQLAWFNLNELTELEFPAANKPVVELLLGKSTG